VSSWEFVVFSSRQCQATCFSFRCNMRTLTCLCICIQLSLSPFSFLPFLNREQWLYSDVTYWFHTYVHVEFTYSVCFSMSVHVFSYKEIEMSWLDLGVGPWGWEWSLLPGRNSQAGLYLTFIIHNKSPESRWSEILEVGPKYNVELTEHPKVNRTLLPSETKEHITAFIDGY